MDKESLRFIEEMFVSHSPSGFEAETQNLWLKRTRPFADKAYKDVHGNAIAAVNPDSPFKVMLAGHCDEIGLMVTNITDDGYLELGAIGGFGAVVAPGTPVQVMGDKGIVDGVIGKKAFYRGDEEEAKKVGRIEDLWVDIGAKDKKQAEKYVKIGNAIAAGPTFKRIINNLVVSKGIDDRVGSFICSEVLKLLKDRKVKVGVWAVSTVQEEVGSRGAHTSCFSIDPQVGIAIDVAHASDYPTTKKKFVGDVRLGGGPTLCRGANINPVLGERMEKIAKAKRIPVQIEPVPMVTWTDANPMQMSRAGLAAALVGIPLRYMHSPVEIMSLDDVENASKLLVELICSFDKKDTFIP